MKKLILNFVLLLSINSYAQWNANPIINTPISIAPKGQDNSHAVIDSKGGAIVAWDDNRNSVTGQSDIYAQRIRKNGVVKWTSNGKAICTQTATQKSSSISESDNGSAIITWEDKRAGNYDIYAQKIDSSGNVLWTLDGIAVCSKTTQQKNPKIISDNAGGAIIVWEDSLNNYWDIYAQRVSSTGSLLWTSTGVVVCNSPNTQTNPRLKSDGFNGAIFTWQDKRNNVDYDVYAQRLDNNGSALWTANGVVICNAVNTQNNPRIEPDGANGVLIGWTDKRNAVDNNIYTQRINSTGVVQWATNGVLVCGATNNQSALDMKYLGSNGLLLTWKDDRATANAIYAQLVSLAGVNQLTGNGILISNSLKSINPNTISDGLGGAIIAWQDSTTLGWDIMTQKINSVGAIQWAVGGEIVCSASDDQVNPSQVTDTDGGAVYVWEDHRNFSNYDLYATHFYSNGSVNFVGINELSALKETESICFPNPINSNSVIKLQNNTLNQSWQISIYDSFGHLIENNKVQSNDVYLLNKENYSSGVYFYFITINGNTSYSKGSFISSN
jgi:hypothetical protein